MTDPVVSVVVPTFGRPRYLQRALESVLLQTFQDWECLVVDDGGTGNVQLPDDNRFRSIRRPTNGGPAAARNSGIEAARGRYVAFLDDDDLFTPVRLHAGLAGKGTEDRSTITVVQLLPFDEHGVGRETDRIRGPRLRTHFPHVGQVLVPRDRVQPFDESLRTAEDADWWLRVAHDAPLLSSPILGYLLRRHPEVRLGVDHAATFRNRMRVYEKHQAYMRRNRRARSFATDRIASAALLLGERRTSAMWAKRSLFAFPTVHAAKVLGRALTDFKKPNKNKRPE